MDFNTTIDIIIKDLREAREIIDDLKNYPGVPELQIELIKSKCKSAEEIIALLKTIKPDYLSPQDLKEEVDKVKESSKTVSKETLIEINDEDEIGPDSFSGDNLKSDEISDQKVNKEPDANAEATIHERTKGKLTDVNTVADKFNVTSNTFYEQLGNLQSEVEISDAIKSKPITNLTDAIDLNDKFIFIQEIFNGNQDSYYEAIEKLNKVESLSDAKAIIMSYTGEGEENEAVEQLLNLVKRKLPADE